MRTLFLIVCTALTLSAQAATWPAASPSLADVTAAVALASDGDTVTIPAGTASWTSFLIVDKAITLQGAGIGQTIIQDDRSPRGVILLFETVSPKSYRLTGITFAAGVVTEMNYNGAVAFTGTSTSVRVDNCHFDSLYGRGLSILDAVYGLIDNCEFDAPHIQQLTIYGRNIDGKTYGDGSWATPVDWGGPGAVYIEQCNFRGPAVGAYKGAVDSYGGARWVFRYNTVTNDFLAPHGTESAQRVRGTRSYEIYNNTITSDSGQDAGIHLRSGTGVIYNNTITGFGHEIVAVNYRSIAEFTFGGADGTSAWDTNVPGGPFDTGTHTGANGATTLTSSGQGWTVNQWAGYSLHNITQNRFALVESNTADTITYSGTGGFSPGTTMAFDAGDTFELWKVDRALDQVGTGEGDLLTGDEPTPVNLNQEIEPLYQWNNNGGTAELFTTYPTIIEGRDYYDNTAKPGNTAYTYPHPLNTGSTGGATATATTINAGTVTIETN